MKNEYIYEVIDCATGDVLSDLTSKHKKYWINEKDCLKAVANRGWWHKNRYPDVAIVKLKLLPVDDTAYSKLVSQDIENFAAWLASITCGKETPWSKWHNETYCKNCVPKECRYPDGKKTFKVHECEFSDGKCPFGVGINDLSEKELIKLWLSQKELNYEKD
jgi:hypothetical protein